MKSIISGVIMIVFVVAGAVAADFLKGGSTGQEPAATKKADAKADKESGDYDDEYAKDKPRGDKYYYDFSRQFVVPVMERGKVAALVIMDINLELDQSDADGMFSLEPKFRDALMRELLSLSNEGAFSGQMTNPEKYELIQKKLLRAARTVKDEVQSVLILDIARQDQ